MRASIQSGASQLVNLRGSVDGQHPEKRERPKANQFELRLLYDFWL